MSAGFTVEKIEKHLMSNAGHLTERDWADYGLADLVNIELTRSRTHLSVMRAELAALRARVAEFESQAAQPSTLQPRRCVTGVECFKRGAESMREVCAVKFDELAKQQADLWAIRGNGPATSYELMFSGFAKMLRALPIPPCPQDCNPLEPDAVSYDGKLSALRLAIGGMVKYINHNTLNFQLEKMQDYIDQVVWAYAALEANADLIDE